MEVNFEDFLKLCEKLLGDKKEILKLAKKRFDECDPEFKSSDTFKGSMYETVANIYKDNSNVFVYLRNFLNVLKKNKLETPSDAGAKSASKKRHMWDSSDTMSKRTRNPSSESSSDQMLKKTSAVDHSRKMIDIELSGRNESDKSVSKEKRLLGKNEPDSQHKTVANDRTNIQITRFNGENGAEGSEANVDIDRMNDIQQNVTVCLVNPSNGVCDNHVKTFKRKRIKGSDSEEEESKSSSENDIAYKTNKRESTENNIRMCVSRAANSRLSHIMSNKKQLQRKKMPSKISPKGKNAIRSTKKREKDIHRNSSQKQDPEKCPGLRVRKGTLNASEEVIHNNNFDVSSFSDTTVDDNTYSKKTAMKDSVSVADESGKKQANRRVNKRSEDDRNSKVKETSKPEIGQKKTKDSRDKLRTNQIRKEVLLISDSESGSDADLSIQRFDELRIRKGKLNASEEAIHSSNSIMSSDTDTTEDDNTSFKKIASQDLKSNANESDKKKAFSGYQSVNRRRENNKKCNVKDTSKPEISQMKNNDRREKLRTSQVRREVLLISDSESEGDGNVSIQRFYELRVRKGTLDTSEEAINNNNFNVSSNTDTTVDNNTASKKTPIKYISNVDEGGQMETSSAHRSVNKQSKDYRNSKVKETSKPEIGQKKTKDSRDKLRTSQVRKEVLLISDSESECDGNVSIQRFDELRVRKGTLYTSEDAIHNNNFNVSSNTDTTVDNNTASKKTPIKYISNADEGGTKETSSANRSVNKRSEDYRNSQVKEISTSEISQNESKDIRDKLRTSQNRMEVRLISDNESVSEEATYSEEATHNNNFNTSSNTDTKVDDNTSFKKIAIKDLKRNADESGKKKTSSPNRNGNIRDKDYKNINVNITNKQQSSQKKAKESTAKLKTSQDRTEESQGTSKEKSDSSEQDGASGDKKLVQTISTRHVGNIEGLLESSPVGKKGNIQELQHENLHSRERRRAITRNTRNTSANSTQFTEHIHRDCGNRPAADVTSRRSARLKVPAKELIWKTFDMIAKEDKNVMNMPAARNIPISDPKDKYFHNFLNLKRVKDAPQSVPSKALTGDDYVLRTERHKMNKEDPKSVSNCSESSVGYSGKKAIDQMSADNYTYKPSTPIVTNNVTKEDETNDRTIEIRMPSPRRINQQDHAKLGSESLKGYAMKGACDKNRKVLMLSDNSIAVNEDEDKYITNVDELPKKRTFESESEENSPDVSSFSKLYETKNNKIEHDEGLENRVEEDLMSDVFETNEDMQESPDTSYSSSDIESLDEWEELSSLELEIPYPNTEIEDEATSAEEEEEEEEPPVYTAIEQHAHSSDVIAEDDLEYNGNPTRHVLCEEVNEDVCTGLDIINDCDIQACLPDKGSDEESQRIPTGLASSIELLCESKGYGRDMEQIPQNSEKSVLEPSAQNSIEVIDGFIEVPKSSVATKSDCLSTANTIFINCAATEVSCASCSESTVRIDSNQTVTNKFKSLEVKRKLQMLEDLIRKNQGMK